MATTGARCRTLAHRSRQRDDEDVRVKVLGDLAVTFVVPVVAAHISPAAA